MCARAKLGDWDHQLAPGQFRQLFDRLPGTMLFAKDTEFRLRIANPAFVARCGRTHEHEIVGLTDADFFPARLASKYRRDDEQVLTTGEPMFDLVELFPNRAGAPEWYVTDKVPLLDRSGRVCGVCGTVRSYEGQRAALQPYLELAAVAEHLKQHFRASLDVGRLADIAGLSTRQFSRRFRATFHMTPRAYLMQLRVLYACEQLTTTRRPITDIAIDAGFYDHADFARHFLRHMGATATAYRAANAPR